MLTRRTRQSSQPRPTEAIRASSRVSLSRDLNAVADRAERQLPNSKYAYLLGFSSAPGEIRTPDLRFRRPTLYPAELRARERGSLEGDRRRRSVVARCAASGPGGIRTLGAGVARPKGPRASAAALGNSHGSGAEGEGFEPSGPGLPVQRFSRPSHSTALPPLRLLG